jgi:hypothetical protein
MPLPIRDGNQSLTTLSTILVGNAHIPAHSVVSLGSQAITDIATAVSGVELGPNTISALENISVTFGVGTSITIGNIVSVTGGLTNAELRASSVTIGGSVSVSNLPVTQTVTFTQASVTFGQASVTFTTPTVTGSVSVLNLPATQTVTFSQASVTFGTAVVTGSASILNFPVTQAVTFGTAVITGSTSIVGTPSVTFTTATITGSTSILNFPASQTVTFTTAPVTFGTSVVTGSVSVLNIPATQTVTFTTATITGSTSILNFPATQTVTFSQASVTFGQASVTFGTPTITGSVSVLNLPATQTVTFTQASVTFGATTGSVSVLNFPVTQGISGTVTASNPVLSSVCVGAGGMILAGGLRNALNSALQLDSATGYLQTKVESMPAISGTVTVGNTVTIAGTVTANVPYTATITGAGANFGQGGALSGATVTAVPVILSSVGVNGSSLQGYNGLTAYFNVGIQNIGNSTLAGASSLPVSGTVTANLSNVVTNNTFWGGDAIMITGEAGKGLLLGGIDPSNTAANIYEGGGVPIIPRESCPSFPISGTVTVGSMPSGALTTRFGSVTTANTAQLTSAVTNTSRKFLLVQNIATSTVTIGIGFAPTTTQGIQLTAGAGLTFDAFCPTGAVYWLSSVTGSNWSILES